MLQFFFNQRQALLSGDIALESNATFDGWNWVQINTNFNGSYWHVFRTNLQPKIKECFLERLKILTILLVQRKDQPHTWTVPKSHISY